MLVDGSSFFGIYDDVNELQLDVFSHLLGLPSMAAPRGLPTSEIIFAGLELRNPRRRLTSLKRRGFSPQLAIGELCWHLRGERHVEPLTLYAPRWRQFADLDGNVRGSCYGYKIFRANGSRKSQWQSVLEILRKDPDSRRAILNFQGEDFYERINSSVDVSCISSLQFFIREKKLHAICCMRSNDAYLGLPYDIFLMTVLQELMSINLRLEIGSYYHHCGSIHLYADRFEKVYQIIEGVHPTAVEMDPIQDVSELDDFLKFEEAIRLGDDKVANREFLGFFKQCEELLLN